MKSKADDRVDTTAKVARHPERDSGKRTKEMMGLGYTCDWEPAAYAKAEQIAWDRDEPKLEVDGVMVGARTHYEERAKR